jgi:hypothetical protein
VITPSGRRVALAWLLLAGLACSRSERPGAPEAAPAPAGDSTARSVPTVGEGVVSPASGGVRQLMLDFPASSVGSEKAIVLLPEWGRSGEQFPILVALHGRGESVRGVLAGANGWVRDYELDRAMARLRSPPLTREDFKGFVTDARLARINDALAIRPFRGLVIVCPWVPDLLAGDRNNLDAAVPFGDFVVGQLLPRVLAEVGDSGSPLAIGIDGVSLGGRAALLVGLRYADRFKTLGTLQAAVQEPEAVPLARRARAALGVSSGLRLRLLTSDQDYFRAPIAALHAALVAEEVAHEHLVVVGPHDYPFNRGPGGIEMLLWHDRVLRGEDPI